MMKFVLSTTRKPVPNQRSQWIIHILQLSRQQRLQPVPKPRCKKSRVFYCFVVRVILVFSKGFYLVSSRVIFLYLFLFLLKVGFPLDAEVLSPANSWCVFFQLVSFARGFFNFALSSINPDRSTKKDRLGPIQTGLWIDNQKLHRQSVCGAINVSIDRNTLRILTNKTHKTVINTQNASQNTYHLDLGGCLLARDGCGKN